MARTVIQHVEGSTSLGRVVRFTGLSHDMLLHPIVMGEPVLTAQAFYYLDDLDVVTKIRFEKPHDEMSDDEIEYLVDNYLFEYSLIHDDQNWCSKTDRLQFWLDDPSEFYVDVDNRNTQSLVLDGAADPDVQYVAPATTTVLDLSDWDIGRNCVKDRLSSYTNELSALMEAKVSTFILPNENRSGYRGNLRVIKPGGGLLDFRQALDLQHLSVRSIKPQSTAVPLGPSCSERCQLEMSVEHVSAQRRYVPVLLSHYFSGLKEVNAMKAFLGFYNVLEYFFGEVPVQPTPGRVSELRQLTDLMQHLFNDHSLRALLSRSAEADLDRLAIDMPTSSGISIKGLDLRGEPCIEVARYLYDLRCAVVHSKKTRNGRPTASFEPYSTASTSLQCVVPMIRRIAAASMIAEGTISAG